MAAERVITIDDLPEEFHEYGPVGAACAAEVSREAEEAFQRWLDAGKEAGMEYLRRHAGLRRDPRLLLEGARTVITFAFPYSSAKRRDPSLPTISEYALGNDYHDVIRGHLNSLAALLPEGTRSRVCVDTAPLPERYWAVRSGLGYIGRNGALIVPGIGSRVFLAEIITTLAIKPPEPLAMSCHGCGRCREACPDGALGADGTIDCRRCLSYLTIEHRGDWTSPEAMHAMATPAGRNTLYGCDRCITVCPLNRQPSQTAYPLLPGLEPRPEMLRLDAGDVRAMDREEFSRIFKGSAMKRAKIEGMKRNAR